MYYVTYKASIVLYIYFQYSYQVLTYGVLITMCYLPPIIGWWVRERREWGIRTRYLVQRRLWPPLIWRHWGCRSTSTRPQEYPWSPQSTWKQRLCPLLLKIKFVPICTSTTLRMSRSKTGGNRLKRFGRRLVSSTITCSTLVVTTYDTSSCMKS